MPIYEFKCNRCSKKFEFLVMAGKEEKIACPECNSEDIKKLITVFRRPKNSRAPVSAEGTCCGSSDPCDNPKKCCEL
ncbi:MAG: zinc ribbon domain-containing protein [Elusimicrobiota bacterium]